MKRGRGIQSRKQMEKTSKEGEEESKKVNLSGGRTEGGKRERRKETLLEHVLVSTQKVN